MEKKEEEYFTFMMPPSIWSKKPSPSRFKMTIEYAAERYPGSTPILSSREVRSYLGDTSEIGRTSAKTLRQAADNARHEPS